MVAKGRRFVQLLPATLALLPRGYTSHEHLDKLGLIHMNGRVYDPELGRFLSADPLIQFPESTQGFDRYAYVGNSPLSYTDPSGHGLLSVLGAIVSVAFPQFALLGKFMIAVDGYMEGGLQGALFSVASMAAAQGVGDMFGHAVGTLGNELARAAVHGLIQGALGAAQGGKFGAAFLAAGVTSGYGSSGLGQMGNRVTRVISAAVLGGTVSKIGGGKFANGAVTGAFVQAFGEMSKRGGTTQSPSDDRNSVRVDVNPQAINDGGYDSWFGAVTAGAHAYEQAYLTTSADQELYFTVLRDADGRFYYSTAVTIGTSSDVYVTTPSGFSYAGDVHSHPVDRSVSQETFSSGDNQFGAGVVRPRGLMTPSGDLRMLPPGVTHLPGVDPPLSRTPSICPGGRACLAPHP